MITAHVWRPMAPYLKSVRGDRQPCQFMNCRRPRGEHQRAVSGGKQ